jgi:hypothetical protein
MLLCARGPEVSRRDRSGPWDEKSSIVDVFESSRCFEDSLDGRLPPRLSTLKISLSAFESSAEHCVRVLLGDADRWSSDGEK